MRREMSLEEYLKESFEKADQYSLDIKLRFHPSSRSYIEDYLRQGEIAVDSDGNILVHIRMPESEWLYGMILSYGDMVEVLEPPHLKRIIFEKSLQISRKYQTLKKI